MFILHFNFSNNDYERRLKEISYIKSFHFLSNPFAAGRLLAPGPKAQASCTRWQPVPRGMLLPAFIAHLFPTRAPRAKLPPHTPTRVKAKLSYQQ